MLKAEVLTEDRQLEPWISAWDGLAVALGRPYSSPKWLMPWWRSVAQPRGHRLRVIVVTSGERLVAIFPLWAERTGTGLNHYRLMGADVSSGVEPLVDWSSPLEVTQLAVELLLGSDPPLDVLRLEGVRTEAGWPGLVASSWSGRSPWMGVERREVAPYLTLAGRSYDEWFDAKSTDFRKQARRRWRRLNEQGFTSQVWTDLADVLPRLPAFARLHRSRWEHRGGSGVMRDGAGTDEMLEHVAKELSGTGRLQLWTIERDETHVISADIFLAAGGEISNWLGGFDDQWAALQPGILNLLAAVEGTWRSETYDRLDLGAGEMAFKRKFGKAQEEMVWVRAVRRGWRPYHSPAQFVPWAVRRSVVGLQARFRRPGAAE